MHSALIPPKGTWWVPVGRAEKLWVTIAFVWCMVMFAMMPLWHLRGGQNPSGIRAKVDPKAFVQRVNRFVQEYRTGELNGIPVVTPPPGSDVYLLGKMWQWYPVIKLQKGATYTLHLSSADVNHGFSLYPMNINFQVVPGYDYGLRVVPNEAGEYSIVCNEFCGIGHHTMVGRVIVEEAPAAAIETEEVSQR